MFWPLVGSSCCVTAFCWQVTPATVSSISPMTFCCRCCRCTATKCQMFASPLHERLQSILHSLVHTHCLPLCQPGSYRFNSGPFTYCLVEDNSRFFVSVTLWQNSRQCLLSFQIRNQNCSQLPPVLGSGFPQFLIPVFPSILGFFSYREKVLLRV